MIYPKFPQHYLAATVICLILTLASLGATFLIYLFNEGYSPFLFSSGGGAAGTGNLGANVGDLLGGLNALHSPARALAAGNKLAERQQEQTQKPSHLQQQEEVNNQIFLQHEISVWHANGNEDYEHVKTDLDMKLHTRDDEDDQRVDDGDDDDDAVNGTLEEMHEGRQQLRERNLGLQRKKIKLPEVESKKQFQWPRKPHYFKDDDDTLLNVAALFDNKPNFKLKSNKHLKKHDRNKDNYYMVETDLRLAAEMGDAELEVDMDANNDVDHNIGEAHATLTTSNGNLEMDVDVDGLDDIPISAENYQQPKGTLMFQLQQQRHQQTALANGDMIYIDDFERPQPTKSGSNLVESVAASGSVKQQSRNLDVKDTNYFDTIINDNESDRNRHRNRNADRNVEALEQITTESISPFASSISTSDNLIIGDSNVNGRDRVPQNTAPLPQQHRKKLQPQNHHKEYKNNITNIENKIKQELRHKKQHISLQQIHQQQELRKLTQGSERFSAKNKHSNAAQINNNSRNKFKHSLEKNILLPPISAAPSTMALNLDALYDSSYGYSGSYDTLRQHGVVVNTGNIDDDDGDDDADEGYFAGGSGSGNDAINDIDNYDLEYGGYRRAQKENEQQLFTDSAEEHVALHDNETKDFIKFISFRMLNGVGVSGRNTAEVSGSENQVSMHTSEKKNYKNKATARREQLQLPKSLLEKSKKRQQQRETRKSRKQQFVGNKRLQHLLLFHVTEKSTHGVRGSINSSSANVKLDKNNNRNGSTTIDAIDFYNDNSKFSSNLTASHLYQNGNFLNGIQQLQRQHDANFPIKKINATVISKAETKNVLAAALAPTIATVSAEPSINGNFLQINTNKLRPPTPASFSTGTTGAIVYIAPKAPSKRFNMEGGNSSSKFNEHQPQTQPQQRFYNNIVSTDVLPTSGTNDNNAKGARDAGVGNGGVAGSSSVTVTVSKDGDIVGNSAAWLETRTRRIIGNVKKSEERSRQLLLCEEAGGGELCRMLFKGHLNE